MHDVTPPGRIPAKLALRAGFTLIEMAVVLVIIGLIVGAILVGQDLIGAAAVRGTISQIAKYNAAANTFRNKYSALPGDINGNTALQLGLSANGMRYQNWPNYTEGLPGLGDGNGVIECTGNPQYPSYAGGLCQSGETALFWQDLLSLGLIEDSTTGCPGTPAAAVGNGNCFFVWNGGWAGGDGVNYYDLSVYVNLSGYGRCSGCLASNPGLTVKQAYAIDSKMDDGFPQSGNVESFYLSANSQGQNDIAWAGVGSSNQGGIPVSWMGATYTTATPGSATTCFDNGNTAGTAQHYSLEANNGAGVNCALSFRFQ